MLSRTIDEQLESEALTSNQQLLNFDIRSKEINWHDFVAPLRPRAPALYLQRHFPFMSSYGEPMLAHNKREVMICHDMLGNYREDRFFRSSKKFDDYRFYHWAGVDYFCYFSHNYVTIPPCGWINAAHKHGVRVLGTFIAERFTGSKLLLDVLKSIEMVNKVVDALVKLCNHFKFEGWLVNIECKVEAKFMANLFYFVGRLRAEIERRIEYGCVFWYDSVIESGELRWQNEINRNNVRFFKSANSMLINYAWNDRSLENSLNTIQKEHAERHCAFVGIDVFGRGQVAKFQTKLTLARVVQKNLSVGIFGPGWIFETLQQFGYNINQRNGDEALNDAFLERNDKFWWSLWDQLATHPYNHLPFYTDLCLGSGKCRYAFGQRSTRRGGVEQERSFFDLSMQSLQPSVPLYKQAERCYDDAFNGGSSLRILHYDISFRLFCTNFEMKRRGLVCAYAFKLAESDGEFDCILRVCIDGANARDCYLFLGDYFDTLSVQQGRCYVSPFKAKYNDYLNRSLDCVHIPKDLSGVQANGWRVRYFVLAFDSENVCVKDIGVLYRRTEDARGGAYLGALYVNEFDGSSFNFPQDSNFAFIKLSAEKLLN